MKITATKIVFYLFIVAMIISCDVGESQNKTETPKPLIDARPPVIYHPMKLQQWTRMIHDEEVDTLFMHHKVIATNDTSFTLDFMYSNIEVYNNADSLLYQFCREFRNEHIAVQTLHLKELPSDSFKISTWGFGFDIDNNIDSIHHKELTILTSLKYYTNFPRAQKQ